MDGITTDAQIEDLEALIKGRKFRQALTASCEVFGLPLGRLFMSLLGSQARADQAIQAVLLDLFQHMPKLSGQPVTVWVYRRALQVADELLAGLSDEELHQAFELVQADDATVSAEAAVARVKARQTRKRLRALKPLERSAALLRFQVGLDYSVIARICQLEEYAARDKAGRALLSLRQFAQQEQA